VFHTPHFNQLIAYRGGVAASDHVNPEQLQLFMTGTELKGMITDSIDRNPLGGYGGTMDKMWATKVRQSKREGMGHGAGTYKSMKERGWDPPTEVWGDEAPGWDNAGFEINHVRKYGGIPAFDRTETSVTAAHHRIAAAADIEAKSAGTKKPRTIYFPTANNQYEYPSVIPSDRTPAKSDRLGRR